MKHFTYTSKTTIHTIAFGTALPQYSAVLYFWYNWFVIYSQNKMVCDSFSITVMRH